MRPTTASFEEIVKARTAISHSKLRNGRKPFPAGHSLASIYKQSTSFHHNKPQWQT